MIDCVFENLNDVNGGAVSCTAIGQDVSINSSSFLSCSASTSGGGCYLTSSKCQISSCCVSGCFANSFGNSIYFGGSGVRWIEIIGIDRSSPNSNGDCKGGLHFSTDSTVNLSCVNITNCHSSYYSCVSSAFSNNMGVQTVSLTGRYLNAFNNSGQIGFYRANGVGEFGWYLWFCNFYDNTITIGVLGTYQNTFGMTVNSSIFSGNTADIGFRSGSSLGDNNKFKLANCVFSGGFPSANIASSGNCKSNSITQSWFLSSRLCPTYSASKSVSQTPTPTHSNTPTQTVSRTATNRFSVSSIFGGSVEFSATLTPIQTLSVIVSPTFVNSDSFSSSLDFIGTNRLSHSTLLFGSLHFDVSVTFMRTSPFEKSHPFNVTLGFIQTVSFPSQDSDRSESGSSVGLIVGVVLSILIIVIVIGIVIGFFVLRRRRHHSRGVESQSSSDADRSVLKMDFINDHIGDDGDDTILTTYTDQVTDDGDLQSIPTDFVVNLGSPLIG
jgi:hypothetical protein